MTCAAHVIDLPFLFGTFGPSPFSNVWFSEATRPGRFELSAAMMQTMASFARADPNNASLGVTWATWPRFVSFNASATAKSIQAN